MKNLAKTKNMNSYTKLKTNLYRLLLTIPSINKGATLAILVTFIYTFGQNLGLFKHSNYYLFKYLHNQFYE